MPAWLWAGFWGVVAGSALMVGAVVGYDTGISQRLIAAVMAFGAGVLISVLSFDLMDEAYKRGGFMYTALGFVGGAAVYSVANWFLARHGAKHRKRSGLQQAHEKKTSSNSGLAIAVGSLLDGIPESLVIGLSMISGGAVSTVAVAGIFLSNIPEGLSASAGMKKAGRSPTYVFGLWVAITLISGVASVVGYTAFRGLPEGVVALTTATAAGAVLAMLADTMMPEAFAYAHDLTGLITVAGFMAAFVLSKLSEHGH